MKKLLIGINSLLAFVIVIMFISNLTPADKKNSPAAAAVRKNSKRDAENQDKKTTPAPLPELAGAVEKIVAADVFSNVRSPLANVRSGRNEMTLVGTFKMGNVEGAIIRQTGGSRQFNPFLMQAMRMSNSMQGGSSFAAGNGYTRRSMMGGAQNVGPVKQYVRLGETLANGYVLAEVSRTRAVLVRGNDKMELELQDPSKNRASASRRAPRLNSSQQFQQAQMFMQSQMIRTLRELQNGGQRGAPANRGRR